MCHALFKRHMKKKTYVGHVTRRICVIEAELAELAQEYQPGSASPEAEHSLLAIVSNLVDFEILFQRLRKSPGRPAGRLVVQFNRLFAEIEDLLEGYRRAGGGNRAVLNSPMALPPYRLAAA